jgi:putative redox protein
MDVNVSWKKDMLFEGTCESGYPVSLVSDSSLETGADPVELLAIALAGCTAMDVISILNKKRQKVTHFDVKLRADRSLDHPQVITRASLEYLVAGVSLEVESVLKAIDLSATKYCPVQAMLSKAFPIELHYSIYEAGPAGQNLIGKGIYQPSHE